MGEYGLKQAVQRLVGNRPWLKLFSIKEKVYRLPTYTLLSTFKVKFDSMENKMHNEVEFYAFGRMHRYGIYEFI